MSIQKELDLIKNAVYGKEVRGAIHDGIKKAYDDAAKSGNANMEVELARGKYPTLNGRLENLDQETSSLNRQLVEKVGRTDLSGLLDGSPQGTYRTLSELNLNHPQGAKGIYVIRETGLWYFWNGSIWEVGGEYQASLSSFKNMFSKSNTTSSISTTALNERIFIAKLGNWSRFYAYSDEYQQNLLDKTHKYYVRAEVKDTSLRLGLQIRAYFKTGEIQNHVGGYGETDHSVSVVFTPQQDGIANIAFQAPTVGVYERVNQIMVDLTNLYGIGKEPSKEEFEELLSLFTNNWFDVNTNFNTVQQILLQQIVNNKKGVVETTTGLDILPKSDVRVLTRNVDKKMIWYDTKRKIIYAVSFNNQKELLASSDYGLNWKMVYSAPDKITSMRTLSSGYHLIRDSAWGKIRRLKPNFTSGEYHSIPDTLIYAPINSANGIVQNSSGTILWAEYSAEPDVITNIYRSVDDGVSWKKCYVGSEIRHVHSVQVDPYTQDFWACTGDSGTENKIIKSSDNGVTWQTMTEGTQSDRAVGLVFTKDMVYWGSDSTSNPKTYQSKKIPFSKQEIVSVPGGNSVLGATKTVDGSVLFWSRTELTNITQKDYASFFILKDGVIKKNVKFVVDVNKIGGFTVCSDVDDNNIWFANSESTTLNGLLCFSIPLSS